MYRQCQEQLSGSFKLRQYHFVIAVGVFIFVHAMITSTYYLLPVDEQNEKYVPGKLASAYYHIYIKHVII